MPATIQEAVPFILLGIALLIAFLIIFAASRRKVTVVDKETGDVLDEGASPAARNQALIDAAPQSMEHKFGDTTAAANTDEVAAAGAQADAEAGASVAASGLAATQAAPQPAPAPAPDTGGDELTRIKGLGPKLAELLNEQGITTFAQIAAWSDEDVARIDSGLGRFQGRIERDQWVEQAKLLAGGDEAGFSSKFGQNG